MVSHLEFLLIQQHLVAQPLFHYVSKAMSVECMKCPTLHTSHTHNSHYCGYKIVRKYAIWDARPVMRSVNTEAHRDH